MALRLQAVVRLLKNLKHDLHGMVSLRHKDTGLLVVTQNLGLPFT